jgi:circadian clock protein KaiC
MAGEQNQSEPNTGGILQTGIPGLDQVLAGGLTANRLYVIEGLPGSGKTTLAMQFLLEGVRRGERVLCVTLSETEEELQAVARSHGWSLEGVRVCELTPTEDKLNPDLQYTVFHPSELELSETTRSILSEVDRLKPSRVVIDSLSELHLLAGTALRYRRQILALKQFFTGRQCTVLLLDDQADIAEGLHPRSIAHAVIVLDQLQPEYGGERRRLRVSKYRGVHFHGGYHDFIIRRGGLEVFRRMVQEKSDHRRPNSRLSSGIADFDALLGGGLDLGTSTLITGATGTGKSTLAVQFALAAAQRGERAALFLFDESVWTLLARCDGLQLPVREHVAAGRIVLHPVDPAELSPGEFAHAVVQAAQQESTSIVAIDSLNGYLNAMPEERFLTIQLHELLSCLGRFGVATLLVGVQPELIGSPTGTPGDASYLADTIILLRYFESAGEVRQAISVVKKRAGEHERTIREYRIERGGMRVGSPLREFRGVLTGIPTYQGSNEPLLRTGKS